MGILTLTYNLRDELKKIRGCDEAGFKLGGRITLRVVVENIGKPKPRETRTPPVELTFSGFPTN
jgi:hypothetical protein